jgi:hypothetical protein
MGKAKMKTCVSEILRKLAATIQMDDTPSDSDIRKREYTIDNPVTSIKINKEVKDKSNMEVGNKKESEDDSKKAKPEISDKVRISKRPHIKAPRREESFKTEWGGQDKREKRNTYQKEYRMENGNT